MKYFKPLLLGTIVLILVVVLLTGCGGGVSQADYDALEAELAAMQEIYPPKDFSSLAALNEWLLENDVSEKPITAYGEDWFGRALEVQEDAARDGYLVSADYDYDAEEETYVVWCTTIINGRVFYWDPETDDVFEDTAIGTVK